MRKLPSLFVYSISFTDLDDACYSGSMFPWDYFLLSHGKNCRQKQETNNLAIIIYYVPVLIK